MSKSKKHDPQAFSLSPRKLLAQERAPRSFHNPYNFVPLLRRPNRAQVMDMLREQEEQHGIASNALRNSMDLCDGPPPGHHVWRQDLYHGWMDVVMTLETPLLLPDAERAKPIGQEEKHLLLPVTKRDGKPWFPPTSLKGALRSAYECITASRLPRFDKHDGRLGYRMAVQRGLELIPARISRGSPGAGGGDTLRIELLTGTARIGPTGRAQGSLYAAWLPRYPRSKAVNGPSGKPPEHGEQLWARMELMKHRRGFKLWRVRELALNKRDLSLPLKPRDQGSLRSMNKFLDARGWVFVSNQNIKQKHDERFFFADPSPKVIPVPESAVPRLRKLWKDVVMDYRACHGREEIWERGSKAAPRNPWEYIGPKPGKTAWSRHVYEKGVESLAGASHGTLCYLRRDASGHIEGIFPVNISRELFPVAPAELLPSWAAPAGNWGEFSPADRVFGWVSQNRPSGRDPHTKPYRGHVRIGQVSCEQSFEEAVESFPGDGLPLSILASPKPRQGRFYLGRADGSAQDDGISKREAGFRGKKRLRGIKVYPHHLGLPRGHWDNPVRERGSRPLKNSKGHSWYQEYRRLRDRRTGAERDSQNRSIEGWVKPGTTFTFRIWIDNLSRVELGALVYLLQAPTGSYLRLGGGKPFGFGSAHLQVREASLLRGSEKVQSYADLSLECQGTQVEQPELGAMLDDLAKDFLEATAALLGESPPHLLAYEQAARGFPDQMPLHYPRSSSHPTPEGEAFKWFVANDRMAKNNRTGRSEPLHGYTLDDLAGDRGLPIIAPPVNPKSRGGPSTGGRRRGRGRRGGGRW